MFDEINARNYRVSGRAVAIASAVAGGVMALVAVAGPTIIYAGAGAAALFIISRVVKG